MNDKLLIAYFLPKGSGSAATKTAADMVESIFKSKGFDTVEFAITPVETYPQDSALFTDVAKMEKHTHYRPALTGKVGKFHDYQNIVLIAPNWFNDFPMAIYTFFDDYDFSGKRLLPIVLHSGDGGKKMRRDLRDYIHKADVLDGVDIDSKSYSPEEIEKATEQLLKLLND